MDKYLTLCFRSATLFRKNEKTKDKIFDRTGIRERKDSLQFKEPITVYQISNVIHVLFGKRPKPINRENFFPNSQYLFDKANDSYLRIDSYKNANGEYYSEVIQTKKAVWNSWSKSSVMNWNRVKNLLEDKCYDQFIATIEEVFNVKIEDVTFYDIKKRILETKNNDKLDAIISLIKDTSDIKSPIYNRQSPWYGKSALWSAIFGDKRTQTAINQNPRTMLTVLNGVDRIIKLDGEILVPVSDEDIEIINRNKGCATILDGGVVTIKHIRSANVTDINGFIQVKSISLEKE